MPGLFYVCAHTIELYLFTFKSYSLVGPTVTRPPSCQTPRQPTIYEHTNVPLSSENTWTPFHHPQNFPGKYYSAILTIVSHV